jgi:NAD(P)-dependent dehydrogenase (short-subunit alcohol dehydrogenase family)
MAAPVIVFGPTGNIASYAARKASELGAKVILAMRDTSKSIPGLSEQDEKSGKYERVTADLSDPKSVSAAVEKTGAKRVFFYLVWTMMDHMKSTIEALKASGVEFIVFLSSSTIQVPKEDVPPTNLIPYMHAQVEISKYYYSRLM